MLRHQSEMFPRDVVCATKLQGICSIEVENSRCVVVKALRTFQTNDGVVGLLNVSLLSGDLILLHADSRSR